ncbi:putative uncharacterized protein [Odoribacter sp. CAG:788]|jgi:hypothetical protein|nr:putative uncharacterized protein [Odoribacter sp. CAG:788]
MANRTLQIRVLNKAGQNLDFVACELTVDGRSCRFAISKRDYSALVLDGFFTRTGEIPDSDGYWNVTRVYKEEA